MEIEINFNITTEYTWYGELSDLPASIRKGGKLTRREDGETVLNEDALTERLDDDALYLLSKSAEQTSAHIELEEVTETA